MKKKQPTFAERAKAIKNKYPRAEWDKIERKDMMKELEALKEEQEEMREIMGIAEGADGMDQQEEFEKKYGGKLMWSGGDVPEWYKNATNPSGIKPNYSVDFYSGNSGFLKSVAEKGSTVSSMYGFNQTPKNIPNSSIYPTNNGSDYGKMITPSNAASFGVMKDSMLPFAVSAGMSAIGDIAGLINMKKNMPKNVTLPRVSANLVNLEPQRQAIQRQSNTNRNVMLRNSRDVSSPANAYANQIAGLSALTDSTGTQIGQSYMNQENANAQIKNEASSQNARIGSQEQMFNAQLQGQNAQIRAKYLDSLANTVPSALRDYRQQVNQTNMLNIMGKDYGLYQQLNQNMSFRDKLAMGFLGPQYTIRNRNSV